MWIVDADELWVGGTVDSVSESGKTTIVSVRRDSDGKIITVSPSAHELLPASQGLEAEGALTNVLSL